MFCDLLFLQVQDRLENRGDDGRKRCSTNDDLPKTLEESDGASRKPRI